MKILKPRAPNRSDLLANPACFLGLGLGSGMAPKAPGTFGTLVAIPFYVGASLAGEAIFWLITVITIASGSWICGVTAKQLDNHDHPAIVWDEFAGYFVTMLLVPFSWQNVIAGFLLFRIFDILKPWPIKWVDQKIHGGAGIMLDDLIAGLFSAMILWWGQPWLDQLFAHVQ